jgi:hypothetical protein
MGENEIDDLMAGMRNEDAVLDRAEDARLDLENALSLCERVERLSASGVCNQDLRRHVVWMAERASRHYIDAVNGLYTFETKEQFGAEATAPKKKVGPR